MVEPLVDRGLDTHRHADGGREHRHGLFLRRPDRGTAPRADRLHGRARLPGRARSSRSQAPGGDFSWERPPAMRALQGRSPTTRTLEPLPTALAFRGRPDQRAVRAAGRDQWPQPPHRAGGDELRSARHRKHGAAGHVRHRGTARAVARAAAEGRDPLGLQHDRTGASHRPTPATSSTSIRRDGDEYVINGRKWWTTGILSSDCKLVVVMGLSDPDADRHERHTMLLVPRDSPGLEVTPWAVDHGLLGRDPRWPRRGRLRRRQGRPGRRSRRAGKGVRPRARLVWGPAASTTA